MPIGFFAPLPLAIMIPFMAAQSFAMGHAFGTSFQYGKRKISSMSNEEFNALSATDLHGELQADIRAMIPNMNQSFKIMEQFQIDIINSMVNTLKLAGEQFFRWITTGKTGTEEFQTETGFSNIDFTGGTFEIQGGSRQHIINPNDFKNSAGQTYEEFLAELKNDETFISVDQRRLDEIRRLAEQKRLNVAGFTKTTGPVNVRAVTVKSLPTTGSRVQDVRAASAANKIRIKATITNIAPLIQNKRAEIANLKKFYPIRVIVRGASGVARSRAQAIQDGKFAKKVVNYKRALKILQNQLLDLLKKLSNAKIQLSNLR